MGYNKKNGNVHIKVDPIYFRPTDVDELRGDSSKAKRELNWKPKIKAADLLQKLIFNE